MARSRLIVNPVSGADAGPDYLVTMNERLRARVGPMDIVITIAEGDAGRAAQEALQDGYERLFVAGGDGTLNEVINGIASVDKGLDAITFGVIPLGTGNDFATALGIPETVELAIDVLLRGDVRRVDVGRLNDSYFVNVSAGGFLAEVSDAVNPTLKTLTGKLAYLIGGAGVLLEHKAIEATLGKVPTYAGRAAQGIAPAGGELPSRISLEAFAVCNSRLVGGGRLIAPYAILDDGELDVCFIHEMPVIEFVRLLRRVSAGEHVEDERVTYFRTPELDLTLDRPTKVNLDGQVVETDHCRYSIMPRAARFLANTAA